MKQKITVKVQMECESCRNKALKIASQIKGVSSVAIEGDDKDKVVVTGENVDAVCLGKLLRKKFRIVTVLTVEEVKPKKDDKKDEKKEPKCCTLCIVPYNPCSLCHSPKCRGDCKPPCPKCHNCNCKGDCKPPCSKCHSCKCSGDCKPCSHCLCFQCSGQCTAVSVRPCSGQCPPWYQCTICCVKRPPPCPPPCLPPYDPCAYRVVYDSNPDSCSIQ